MGQAMARRRSVTTTIPQSHIDLLTTKKAFAQLATLMPDGSPQVTPVWIDYDGSHILINTAKGRMKDRNMQERSSIAMSVSDPDNPYRYLGVRGRVVEITEEGADEHINKMSKKYLGKDVYPYRKSSAEVRRIYKVAPERVHVMG
jgi:PPOX class probable F420-dependent enzyme